MYENENCDNVVTQLLIYMNMNCLGGISPGHWVWNWKYFWMQPTLQISEEGRDTLYSALLKKFTKASLLALISVYYRTPIDFTRNEIKSPVIQFSTP